MTPDFHQEFIAFEESSASMDGLGVAVGEDIRVSHFFAVYRPIWMVVKPDHGVFTVANGFSEIQGDISENSVV